jgi:uncharacterized 2Fe-2S/4Fe-4S cluster protein (DUF4445 family)
MAKRDAGGAKSDGVGGRDGMSDKDALVVFTPSGRRARVPVGTPLLQAARSLGVDIDSVCGGRGICGRCQVLLAEGEFAKHGVTSRARNLSPFGAVERNSAAPADGPGSPAVVLDAVLGRLVIDVPVRQPGAPAGRAQGRRGARHRARSRRPACTTSRCSSPTCTILPAISAGSRTRSISNGG